MEASQRIVFEFDHEQSKEFLELMREIKGAINSPKGYVRKPEFLNVGQAAAFLNIAKQTVYQLNMEGRLPSIKKGKRLYFREADLIAWIEKGNNLKK